MPTYVYQVDDGEGLPTYHPTAADARREARLTRRWLRENPDQDVGQGVEITKLQVISGLPRRELYCRLLRGQSWVVARERVSI